MLKNQKSVTEFLNDEYLEYAKYVIEQRAIPSLIDGLKPTQRKILYICNKVWPSGSGRPMKVFQIGGRIAAEAYYHHGDCISDSTMIQLADGSHITIQEWYEKYKDAEFVVNCYDETNKKIKKSLAHSIRIGHVTDEYYEIELEDGTIIECTDNHPFLVNDNWLFANELTIHNELTFINHHDENNDSSYIINENTEEITNTMH